jgi:hypothetical protein
MFCINVHDKYNAILVNTIEEIFIGLREEINIPKEIEVEYEKIFLIYKLNDFKELYRSNSENENNY